MVATATSETGQNVQQNVEEELRPELEPVQTLLLQTEELTVLETALKLESVIHSVVLNQVSIRENCIFFVKIMSPG